MRINKQYIFVAICILISALYFTKNKSINNNYTNFFIQKQKWESLGINNYQYSIKSNGNGKMFIFDIIVNVIDGNYVESEVYNTLNKSIYEYLTINEIYENLEKKYLNNGTNLFKNIFYRINVQYDEIYHFPKKVKYSWFSPPFVFDYGTYYMYEINNFEKIINE